MPAPERSLAEPTRYRLLCELARGGMAEVHLARMLGVGGFRKLLVIKRILPELSGRPEHVDMFLDEARIAATLAHPNVVEVFDVGQDDRGLPYLAMEYLHGHDLRTILRVEPQRLPLAQALAVILGACAGLHHAHDKVGDGGRWLGIVHRDVSPQNVFVTFDGAVKVIDFGIAKAVDKIAMTRVGLLHGKLGYMSPEQCRCEPLDRRSDVFCLGILLWESTTGRRLYEGATEWELLEAIVRQPARAPSSIDPSYPRPLEQIVLKALAADPAERYATAKDLQDELEVFARESRLDVTQHALARAMVERFRPEIEAWRAAQRAGIPLDEHLVSDQTPDTDATIVTVRSPDPSGAPVTLTATESAAPPLRDVPRSRTAVKLVVAALALGAAALVIHWSGGSAQDPAAAPDRAPPAASGDRQVSVPLPAPSTRGAADSSAGSTEPARAPAALPAPSASAADPDRAKAPVKRSRRRDHGRDAAQQRESDSRSPRSPERPPPDPDAPLPH